MQNGITEPGTPRTTLDSRAARPAARKPGTVLKVCRAVGNLLFIGLLLVMVVMVFSLVQSRMSGEPPKVAGYQTYIVIGGSMSPTFEIGSLAFLQPVDPQTIGVGDIITYRDPTGGSSLTTHRVKAVHSDEGMPSFTTRGDANRVDDPVPVGADLILGKVQFTVPYAGHALNFAQTQRGLLTLVIIPGVLVIIFELRNLVRYAAAWEAEEKARRAAGDGAPDST